MPRGFLERHLHRRGGGLDTSSSTRNPHPHPDPHHPTPPSTTANFRKVSRTWADECCGGEGELPDDTPTSPAHPLYTAHTARAARKTRDTRASITLDNDLQELLARNSRSGSGVLVLLVTVVLGAWVLGSCGASWAWLMVSLGVTWALVSGALQRAAEDATRYESLRLHRRRALQADETCEWLNILVNRWWVFSSASIFARVKAALDPRLNDAKPAFLEAISLKQLSLGDRTPVLRSVRTWDVTGTGAGMEGGSRRPTCPSRPPPGLSHAPTHTLALMCDLALDSDSFSAVLAARIGGKGMGVDLDVGVEKLAVLGRVVVTATLDMEAPFPHLTRLSLSFTEKPQVWFSVRILKAVQMMEVPVLKTWLHSLVMDALATAWVDPGQLEVNIHSTEVIVPETRPGDTLAQGVLTVILWTLKATSALDEDKWVVVMVDGQQHVTPAITSPRWQEACSFLVSSSPNHHNLVLKVKTKRLITTTLTQFDLPLSQYGLDSCRVAETILQKKGGKVMGGSVPPLHLRLQYTPLTPITLESPLPAPLTDSQEGAGVLYILVHGADNIATTADYPPSPYCLIFSNRKKVKTTHYVCECGSPRWECGVEVLVRDLATVTLAIAVCSLPRGTQDTELLGLASLSLATVELPMVHRQLSLTRSLPTPGGAAASASLPGTVTATVVFRSVPSVAGCNMSSADLGSEKGFTSSFGPVLASQPSPVLTSGVQRRSSLPLGGDDDDLAFKKRSNTPWYSQASRLLGTTRDGEAGTQDIGDIIASGLGLMELTIIRARDLVAKDLNGYSDPYCVVKVNGEVKYRTRVKKKTLNPEWEETLMTHLPKHPDALAITLWDHDAFGRDFLGSVSLREADVRQMSLSDAPVWCALDGTKSGQLEIRVKVISDDYEHQMKSAQAVMSVVGSGLADDTVKVDDECGMGQTEEDAGPTSQEEDSGVGVPSTSPTLEDEEVHIPRVPSHSLSYANNGVSEAPAISNGRRASESALIDSKRDPLPEDRNGTFSGSATPACASPVHSSTRSRRTGAKIIASALSMARPRPRHETSSEASSTTASPTRTHQSSAAASKAVPKISLTEHSEDDYGGSSPEHHRKNKKSDGGLRAVRDKMRRGFAHPLRRFRSEANVREDPEVRPQENLDPCVELALSVGVPVRVGVGGGEGDASELLDGPLTHAKSQPNLLLMAPEAARLSSSAKVMSSSSTNSGHGQQRADVFVNVRGVAGMVQGLHIPRSGLQLFLRVRISDDKSSSSSLSSSFSSSFGSSLSSSSSSSSSGRSTKTVGRSRLVPASPSPTFECEWQVESEVSRRALLILEVRTGSRELLNSANIALGDLFTEPGTEGSVETWVNLQGGATLHLRASHGGQAPSTSRRRSLFRSWSLHKLGKI